MKLVKEKHPEWDLAYLQPDKLSDEQIEHFYHRALTEARDVMEAPKNSVGRMLVASTFVRLLQTQSRRNRQKIDKV